MHWKLIIKITDLSHLVPIWPTFSPNVASLWCIVCVCHAYETFGFVYFKPVTMQCMSLPWRKPDIRRYAIISSRWRVREKETVVSWQSHIRQRCQIWHPYLARLATNGTYLRLFKISFSASQNVLKLILKSHIFVPFWANLTQFVCQIWHSGGQFPQGRLVFNRSHLC